MIVATTLPPAADAAQSIPPTIGLLDAILNDRLLCAGSPTEERHWWRVKTDFKRLIEPLDYHAQAESALALLLAAHEPCV